MLPTNFYCRSLSATKTLNLSTKLHIRLNHGIIEHKTHVLVSICCYEYCNIPVWTLITWEASNMANTPTTIAL